MDFASPLRKREPTIYDLRPTTSPLTAKPLKLDRPCLPPLTTVLFPLPPPRSRPACHKEERGKLRRCPLEQSRPSMVTTSLPLPFDNPHPTLGSTERAATTLKTN
jgi:hypothetical protein